MQVKISIDDGCTDDIKIARLCEKLGLNDVVFYWPVDMLGLGITKGWNALTPSQEAYIARNFEIGSHTITHRYLTKIPLEEARGEIFDSKHMLENKYDKKITKFCYPRGYANEEIKGMVKAAGYEYARSTEIGHIGKPEDPMFAATAVHMGCPIRPEYEGTTWQEYGMKLLKQARDEDKDLEAWAHSWEITRYNEWKNVEKFLKELTRV